ncbi:MAG: RHS repeat protein, partial [Planctomycetaceae bacterium]
MLNTSPLTVTYFEDADLAGSTQYNYKVVAVDQDDDQSSAAEISVVIGDGIAPATPVLQSVTSSHPTIVALTIAAGSGGDAAARFLIYRSTDSSTGYTKVGDVAVGSAVTFLDTGLSPSTDYFYRVYAVDAAGDVSLAAIGDTTTVTVAEQGPFVAITSPSLLEKKELVVSSDMKVFGVVDDPNNNIDNWRLILRAAAGNAFLGEVVIASGTAEVGQGLTAGDLLGTLTPSLVANGIYQLVLEATDTQNNSSQAAGPWVLIKTDTKSGSLNLSFVDLTVDIPGGAPVEYRRIYDSTRANIAGEFGYGWRLAASDVALFTTTLTAGKHGSAASPSLRIGDLVFVNIPGRGQFIFEFLPQQGNDGSYTPEFVCLDGSGSKLTFNFNGTLQRDGDELYDSTYNSLGFNPAHAHFGGMYQLTLPDTSRYMIGADSKLVQAVLPDGTTTSYNQGIASCAVNNPTIHRDSQGRIDWISSPLGQKVTYSYDANGDLVSVNMSTTVDTVGQTNLYNYEDAHDHYLTSIIDPRGVTAVTVTYDAAGKMVQIVDISGNATSINYGGSDGRTSVTSSTDALGNIVETVRDGHANVIRAIQEVRDDSGTVIAYAVSIQDYEYVGSTGQVKEVREYQPFQIAAPDPTFSRYTATSTIEPVQITTFYVTSNLDGGNVEYTKSLSSDGVTYLTTQYLDYNAFGKPTQVVVSYGATTNYETDYEYDTQGNLTRVTKEINNVVHEETLYTYSDGEHNYTYADNTVGHYTNLPANLLLEVKSVKSDGITSVVVEKYVYYGDEASQFDRGRLKSVTDAAGLTTRYTYNRDGQVQSTYQEWNDGASHSVPQGTTTYDSLGRTIATTDALGRTTRTFYDAAGQPIAVKDWMGGYTLNQYDARGNIIRTLSPDGTETRYVYDALGRMTWSMSHYVHDYADGYYFSFNESSGSMEWEGDNSFTADVDHYVYDSLGRVVKVETFGDGRIDILADTAVGGSFRTTAISGATSMNLLHDSQTVYDAAGRTAAWKEATGLWSGSIFYDNGQVRYSGPLTETAATAAAEGTVPSGTSDFLNYSEFKYDQIDSNSADDGLTGRYDKQIDPLGHATRTYRDELDRVVNTLYADGSRSHSVYGDFGQRLTDT